MAKLEEEKKAQGRQKMSEEEKAAAKVKRDEAKQAAEQKRKEEIKTLADDYKTKDEMAAEIIRLQEKLSPPLKLKIDSEDIESITIKKLTDNSVLNLRLFDSSNLQIAFTASEEANQAAEVIKGAIPLLTKKQGKKRAAFKLG